MEEVAVSAKQKGALGEALLEGHVQKSTAIIQPWLTAQLEQAVDMAEQSTIQITHEPRVETFYVYYDGQHMSWTPDIQYTARVAQSFGPLQSSNDRRIEVPIEVKTGAYAELERNQRAVMELLATERECWPVVATVDLEQLPTEFGVTLRSVTDDADPGDGGE